MKATISGSTASISYCFDELEFIRKTVIKNGGSGPIAVGINLSNLMAAFNNVDYNSAEGRECASFIVRHILTAHEPLPELQPSTISSADTDLNEPLPARTCSTEDGTCESYQ